MCVLMSCITFLTFSLKLAPGADTVTVVRNIGADMVVRNISADTVVRNISADTVVRNAGADRVVPALRRHSGA